MQLGSQPETPVKLGDRVDWFSPRPHIRIRLNRIYQNRAHATIEVWNRIGASLWDRLLTTPGRNMWSALQSVSARRNW